MPLIIRPNGDTDFANAQVIAESALPQTITGLAAGAYQIGRLAWNPDPVMVTNPAPSAETFTLSGTGPYFVDPANVPPDTTRIEYEIRMKLATYPPTGHWNVALLSSTANDLTLAFSSGAPGNWRVSVEEGAPDYATLIPATVAGPAPALDQMFTIKMDTNMPDGNTKISIDGVVAYTVPFVIPGNGKFPSVRNISFFANVSGAAPMGAGTVIEYAEAHFTTGGVRSLRKRIAGDAAAVNADPWKQGSNAT